MNKKGLLIIYTGSSGVGKGTIIKELLKRDSNNRISISATTRTPRKGEAHGKEYFFISKEEFKKKIDEGCFLEYAIYCDNFYGTPKKAVEEMLNEGHNVFLEIEVQGGAQIKKCYEKDCISIFIMPPSMEELERRLRGRQTEKEEVIAKRLNIALTEISYADKYDYIVTNNEVNQATNDILNIIKKEKAERSL